MTFLLAFVKKIFGGDLASTFMAILVVILALMAIPTIGKVAGFFGYETKAVLREQLNTEKRNTANLKDANETKDKAIEVLDKTADNVEKAVTDKVERKEKVASKFDKIEKTRTKTLGEVEKLPVPDLEKIEKVSEANILSVWQSYCEASDDPTCSTIPKVPAT